MDVRTFENVLDAIADTPAEAANLKARSALVSAIGERVRSWGLTQEATAARLGVTRPRLSDLPGGKISKFSLDALVNLATAAVSHSKLEPLEQVARSSLVVPFETAAWPSSVLTRRRSVYRNAALR